MKQEQKAIPERINMKKYKHFIIKTEPGTNRIPLTKTDEEAFQSELLLMLQQIDEADINMKNAVKKMKVHIDELRKKRDRARRALDLKYEEREGLRHTIVFAEERRTGIYNEDGQLITDRPMSTTEAQYDLYVETSMMEARQLSGATASKVTIERPSELDDDEPAEQAQEVDADEEEEDDDEEAVSSSNGSRVEYQGEPLKVDDPFA